MLKHARIGAPIVLSAALVACSPPVGEPLHHDPKDSLWQVECQALPDNKHIACYGPGWNAYHPHDPNHYDFFEVSVERPNPSGGSTVVIGKRLEAARVAPQLLQRGKADIVRFDDSRREVTFLVGPEPVVFAIND